MICAMSLLWPTKHSPYRRLPPAPRSRARRTMTRSARRSWRPRGAAGFSASMPGAIAMRIPAWCSMRCRGSRKVLPPRDNRLPKAGSRTRWLPSGWRSTRHKPTRRRHLIAWPWRKIWLRSAGAPGSSEKSHGGGGKSAPTAECAICSTPRSAPSKRAARKSHRTVPEAY